MLGLLCGWRTGGPYLAPGLHPPLLAGFHVTARAQWGRNAGQELAVKWPQAPVVLAVHTLNLPHPEAPTAVPGALYGVREKGRPESLVSGLQFPDSCGAPQSPVKFQACSHEEELVLVQ